jgi:hypothetical protein
MASCFRVRKAQTHALKTQNPALSNTKLPENTLKQSTSDWQVQGALQFLQKQFDTTKTSHLLCTDFQNHLQFTAPASTHQTPHPSCKMSLDGSPVLDSDSSTQPSFVNCIRHFRLTCAVRQRPPGAVFCFFGWTPANTLSCTALCRVSWPSLRSGGGTLLFMYTPARITTAFDYLMGPYCTEGGYCAKVVPKLSSRRCK